MMVLLWNGKKLKFYNIGSWGQANSTGIPPDLKVNKAEASLYRHWGNPQKHLKGVC